MINLDSITNENKKQHNEKCQFIPDHLHRILIIDRSGSRKTIVLLNLIRIKMILAKFICMQKI